MKIPRYGKIVFAITTMLLINASIAMANDEVSPPEQPTLEEAAPVSKTFDSDGSPVLLEEIGMTIAPPLGWTVRTQAAGMSLIMHEKEETPKEIDYSKPLFKRNITVTTRHEATPVDEKTAIELKEGLTKAMEKSVLAKDFQIIEHKFFDYKGKNDGLILYSQLTLGEFPMMQMHVMVSGEHKHYLMTYTDLATEFQSNEAAFQAAWNAMTTVAVEGIAPVRYRNLIVYGGMGLGVILFFALLIGLKRRSNRKSYANYADSIYDEGDSSVSGDPITVSGVWMLDDSAQKAPISSVNTASSFY